ncbi:MAG: hypothetical protein ACOC38_02690 [Promethearchaeia archaeon]
MQLRRHSEFIGFLQPTDYEYITQRDSKIVRPELEDLTDILSKDSAEVIEILLHLLGALSREFTEIWLGMLHVKVRLLFYSFGNP